jgi:pSer/pThr/pTyr-binding forkhead associated (FHA) protein
MDMIAQLIPLNGGNPISITKDVTLVGRNQDLCDLFLNRNSISKLHCIIVKTDGLLFVRDLGSTNGTKVNGQRILRGALLPGDQLAFANIKFRVHLGPGEPEPRADHTEVMSLSSESLKENLSPETGSDSDVRLLEDDEEE